MTQDGGFSNHDIESILEKALENKFDLVRNDILDVVREEQRNMHIEIIRQFEIQKDLLSALIDQKMKDNNQVFMEY